jgi:GNAT superfamily N-acetyltransferase
LTPRWTATTPDAVLGMRKTQSKTTRRSRKARGAFRRLAPGADLADIKALYGEFIVGEWVGDDCTFWELRKAGRLIAFCAAKYTPATGCAALSVACVVERARGRGLQKRMIQLRERWARAQGAHTVLTYVAKRNPYSFANLILAGYRMHKIDVKAEWSKLFYFMKKPLCSA